MENRAEYRTSYCICTHVIYGRNAMTTIRLGVYTPEGNFQTLMVDRLSFSAAVRRYTLSPQIHPSPTVGNPWMSLSCQPVILFRTESCSVRVSSDPNYPGGWSGVTQATLFSTSTHYLLDRGLITKWFQAPVAQSFDKKRSGQS